MSTLQTSIAIDKATKDRAAKRAAQENMPLAVIVRILLVDYANGRISIGTHSEMDVQVEDISVDNATQKRMDAVVKKWRGKIAS